VISFIDTINNPVPFTAFIAASRPDPWPFTKTSAFLSPSPNASYVAFSAAT